MSPIRNMRPASPDWREPRRPLPGPTPSPLFLRPELITHPPLPKPLHGLNPRTINGDKWWDITRKASYARNNFCCWACGRHKSIVLRGWLEGHEYYEIDYELGRARMIEVVALCNQCHNFIHQQRLAGIWESLALQKDFDGYQRHGNYITGVMAHGVEVMRQAEIHPSWENTQQTYLFAVQLGLQDSPWGRQAGLWRSEQWYHDSLDMQVLKEAHSPLWGDWRLVLNGREYKPKHESEEAWAAYYADKNKTKRSDDDSF